jgi:hypothetical protein
MNPFIHKKQALIDAIETASHCQRNWNGEKKIPDDILQLLEYTVETCPTKQNQNVYQTTFVTDRKVIKKIYSTTWRNEDGINDPLKNPQTLANLIIVFSETSNTSQDGSAEISIGIAAGQLSLIATQLGLKCGFCHCFSHDELSQILRLDFRPSLILGIGYPAEGKPHNQHHLTDYFFDTFYKYNSLRWVSRLGEIFKSVNEEEKQHCICLSFDNIKNQLNVKDLIYYEPLDNLSNVMRKSKSIFGITRNVLQGSQILYYHNSKDSLLDFSNTIENSKEWKDAQIFLQEKFKINMYFKKNP